MRLSGERVLTLTDTIFDNTWLKQNEKGFKVIKLAEDKINPNDISTTESQALEVQSVIS
jgi:hypothetical protein